METKKCGTCKKDLPETTEYFATRTDKKTLRYQHSCRDCHKKYRREHYLLNKKKYIDKAVVYRKKISSWFRDIKKGLRCVNCGEDRWWVLDFHHRDPNEKENNISGMARHGSKKALLDEIKKCDVLCANCHRDIHYKEIAG